jgi:predicted double-glycine peptidase
MMMILMEVTFTDPKITKIKEKIASFTNIAKPIKLGL